VSSDSSLVQTRDGTVRNQDVYKYLANRCIRDTLPDVPVVYEHIGPALRIDLDTSGDSLLGTSILGVSGTLVTLKTEDENFITQLTFL